MVLHCHSRGRGSKLEKQHWPAEGESEAKPPCESNSLPPRDKHLKILYSVNNYGQYYVPGPTYYTYVWDMVLVLNTVGLEKSNEK